MPNDTLDQLLGLNATSYDPKDDPWLTKAKPLVEEAINDLIDEFIAHPYLHRREHSIHVRLSHILASKRSPDGEVDLSRRYPLGADLPETQLIHKEWPSSGAYSGKSRRGNVDLAVLSPGLLKTCTCLQDFREGRLPAPIVIEMGLDYGTKHLAKDARKLLDTKPPCAYLVHLVRERPRDLTIENTLIDLERQQSIGTAYVCTIGVKRAFKRLGQLSIEAH